MSFLRSGVRIPQASGATIVLADGTLLGGAGGKLFEVFAPAGWRVGRWAWWWWASRRDARGREPRATGHVVVESRGGSERVRCLASSVRLPNVPGPDAAYLPALTEEEGREMDEYARRFHPGGRRG